MMKRLTAAALLCSVLACGGEAEFHHDMEIDAEEPILVEDLVGTGEATLTSPSYVGKMTAIYLVPSDQTARAGDVKFFEDAMKHIQGWYQGQLGETFQYTVQTVKATRPASWFGCNQSAYQTCWDRTTQHLGELGFPLWQKETDFVVALQSNKDHYLGAGSPTGSPGGMVLVGADSFTELVRMGCGPGQCKVGVAKMGDGITGGIAHEIGHTIGLPHTPDGTTNRHLSVMAEHWRYPNNVFLPSEKTVANAHPLISYKLSTTPPPTTNTTIIVDTNNARNDASVARFQASSNWTSASSTAGYYGTGYFYATVASVSDAADFWFYLPTAQTRTVDAWWTTGTNRSTQAPFLAFDPAGVKIGTVYANQQLNGGKWNTLGYFQFKAGWNRIRLSRWTYTGNVVIADAVRIR